MITRVYRNLNNGKWSLQQKQGAKWLVIGHCDSAVLINATIRQSEAGRQRVIRERRKNVHCWFSGELVRVEGFTPLKGRSVIKTRSRVQPGHPVESITYDPYKHPTIVYRCDSAPCEPVTAVVYFDADQHARATR